MKDDQDWGQGPGPFGKVRRPPSPARAQASFRLRKAQGSTRRRPGPDRPRASALRVPQPTRGPDRAREALAPTRQPALSPFPLLQPPRPHSPPPPRRFRLRYNLKVGLAPRRSQEERNTHTGPSRAAARRPPPLLTGEQQQASPHSPRRRRRRRRRTSAH